MCDQGWGGLDEAGNPRTLKLEHEVVRSIHKKGIKICQVCGKLFAKKFDLQQHSRIHSGEKPFQCALCFKRFTQNSNLKKHLNTHKKLKSSVGDGPLKVTVDFERDGKLETAVKSSESCASLKLKVLYSCVFCDFEPFEDRRSLVNHVSECHDNRKQFGCELCGYDNWFSTYEDLAHHAKVFHQTSVNNNSSKRENGRASQGEETPKQENCQLVSVTLSDDEGDPIQVSAVIGQGSLKYCKYCEITFPTDNGLRLHNLSVDHQLLCPECPPSSGTESESGDGTFANESLLKAHFKQHHPHSALLINACQICQKVFKSEYALRTHLKIHTGDKPYQCNHCDKTFNRKDGLKRHLLAVHDEGTTQRFRCPSKGCLREFKRIDKLRQHIKVHQK